MKFFKIVMMSLVACAFLSGCGSGSSGPKVYTERDLPAAIPVQFQGWWKGKSEWDYLHLAPDGMMQVVFPQDFQAPFNPALTTPSAAVYLKVIRNQGDTLYAVSKEQRFDRDSGQWRLPVYYYVMLHYDFTAHTLTYEQQPCALTETDLEKSAEAHLQRLSTGACTISEEQAGQKTWKRTTSYVRATGSVTQ